MEIQFLQQIRNKNMRISVFSLLVTLTLITQKAVSSSVRDYHELKEAKEHQMKDSNIISVSSEDEFHPEENYSMFLKSRSMIAKDNRQTLEFGNEAIWLFESILSQEKAKLLESSSDLTDPQNSTESLSNDKVHEASNCASDLMRVIKAARMRLQWALEMIDSTGKPESGVLRGNRQFVGDYDECMDVDTGLEFDGRYCTTTILISEFQNTTLAVPSRFQLGVCFPSSCHATEVENHINSYIQSLPNVTAQAVQTSCQERNLTLTTKAIIIICICSLFVTLMLVSTLYDVFYKRWWLDVQRHAAIPYHHDNQKANDSTTSEQTTKTSEYAPIIDPKAEKPKLYSDFATAVPEKETSSAFYDILDQILMSFSVYTNTGKLFAVNQSQDNIGCIDGMRFISTTWIILYHTNIMGYGAVGNAQAFLDDAYSDWTYMPVLKAFIAVDTFFAMSGLLLTFVVLKKLLREEATPKFFGTFYLHRFLRLTPPYMLLLMTYVPLFKYLSDGPLWPQHGIEVDECEDTWWTNLLYVNNFVKIKKTCMPWSWYLACDMQFYLVSPLLFMAMFIYEWKGLMVPFAFLLGNAICSGVITDAKDLVIDRNFENIRQISMESFESFKYYYAKPYTRIGPFVIGMMTGFLLFKFQCQARLSKLMVVVGWIAATATALAVVYGLSDQVSPEDSPSTEVRALYNALHRIAWGMSICWVIFACVTGYGGFVNAFLSWRAFIPLSRLSYCAYLVHPLVIKYYFYSQRKPFYMNYTNVTFAFLAMVILSYAIAYIVYMAYEVPLVGLVKVITGRRPRKLVKQ